MEYNQATLKTMVANRLAILNDHKGEENKFLREKMARDACFTSHRALEWKADQYSITSSEIVTLKKAQENEVTTTQIQSKERLLTLIASQIGAYQANHKADLEVYKKVVDKKGWYKAGKKNIPTQDNNIQKLVKVSKANLMKV